MLRWLIALAAMFSLSTFADGDSPAVAAVSPLAATGHVGYLLHSDAASQNSTSPRPQAYIPQPGDLILFDDFNKFHHFAYRLVGTETPLHVAMVIAREEGGTALLEMTGSNAVSARAVILDVEPRMSSFPGSVQVRRIRQPLAPEQSRDLTCFARAQVGKRFAVHRIILQATPFNCRNGLRRCLFGHTYLNRYRWFCSEMVVAAGTTAHVFDPHVHLANTIYPRDLAFDETLDISSLYHPIQTWTANSTTPGASERPSQH